MEDSIILKIGNKEIPIKIVDNFKQLNEQIIKFLEKEYNNKLDNQKNLYRIYYEDEDKNINYVKSEEDYKFFINGGSEYKLILILELDETTISKITLKKDSPPEKKQEIVEIIKNEDLLKTIEQLKQRNENLEEQIKQKESIDKSNKEKIAILEKDNQLKKSKEQIIENMLKNEKKISSSLKTKLEKLSKAKDIKINSLNEEKIMLKRQLEEQKSKVSEIEKLYNEELEQSKMEFLNESKNDIVNKDTEQYIKSEIEKGILQKSQIIIEEKDKEINKLKNDYENKINKIREECYQEVELKMSQLYNSKIKEAYDSALNKSKIEYDNIISQNQKQFEEEEKKRTQLLNSNMILNPNMSSLSFCRTIHRNITCSNCKIKPITGLRYKCLECKDYNLCEKCEKIIEHKHKFVRFTTEEEEKNTIIKTINNKYSYECLTDNLDVFAYVGSEHIQKQVVIKNNGNIQWGENTKFICDKNSSIYCEEIYLEPLKPGKQDTINIVFKETMNLNYEKYFSNLLFCVDDEIYGEPLTITVNLMKK